MDAPVAFGTGKYLVMLALLLFARGMDFLSTWIASPNLVLEGNPFARKLGWRWGIPLNILICVLLAFWSVPAIVVITTSVLVAARNFQSAWLMRSLGEHTYRDWHIERVREVQPVLFVFCLLAQTLLVAGVGVALVYFSGPTTPQPLVSTLTVSQAVGLGIIAYAIAVAFFTLLAVWKIRRETGDMTGEA